MFMLIITNITSWITEGEYLVLCYLQSRDPLEVKLPRMLVELFAVMRHCYVFRDFAPWRC